MDFGMTGKLGGYYLAEQYRKNAAAGKSEGVGFAELALAIAAGKEASLRGVNDVKPTGIGTYMGESYEERISKITDKRQQVLFKQPMQ